VTGNDTNPIITKIEKLMRLARDQEGKPEGETAARFASRLMTAHAISMHEVDPDRQAEADPLTEDKFGIPASTWRRRLWHELGIHCNLRTAQWAYTGHSAICLYGHKTDIEVCKYLYEICERQIEASARAYINSLDCNAWGQEFTRGQRKKKGNAFRRSAVEGLAEKLRAIRRDTQAENTTGFALVLSRKQKVDNWVDETYTFGNAKAVAEYRHNSAGYSAGRDVNLAAGISGRSTKRLT
jgi:hypothetical protein